MKISKKELNEKAIRLLEVKAEITALEAEEEALTDTVKGFMEMTALTREKSVIESCQESGMKFPLKGRFGI